VTKEPACTRIGGPAGKQRGKHFVAQLSFGGEVVLEVVQYQENRYPGEHLLTQLGEPVLPGLMDPRDVLDSAGHGALVFHASEVAA
jgi:hypothetical protein